MARPHHRRDLSPAVIVCGLVLLVTSCASVREGKVRIAQRPNAANLETVGTHTIDAGCSEGERLLGGGYSIAEAAEPPISGANPLIVQASYPFSDTVWRVVVTRPAEFEEEGDGLPLAVAWATCAAVQGRRLHVRAVPSPEVPAVLDAQHQFETATASSTCPQGMVRTGGGFRISPGTDDPAGTVGLYNAWVWESAPTSPGGWSTTIHRIVGPSRDPPAVQAYAVCAGAPLTGAVVVQADAGKREPIGLVYWDGLAKCAEGSVATGGGYSFTQDPFIPHLVASSTPHVLDGTWSLAAFYGEETPGDAAVTVKAVCLEIPIIVDVAIVRPRGDICTTCTLPVESPVRVGVDPTDPTMSEPIGFVAEATDGAGDPLTGNALQWNSYSDPSAAGTPLGTGESFMARLPAPPPGQDEVAYLVEVVATDPSGNSASDTVFIVVTTNP